MPPDTDPVDRGDDFTPTEGDAPAKPTVDDQAAADKLEAEITAEKAEKEGAKAAKLEVKDPEAEAEGEAEGEHDPEAKPKKDSRIPAARHKEILDRERERRAAVEAELAQYKQGGKIADVNAEIGEAETSLLALETEYAKQIVDGEHEKAAATMAKIRRTERAITEKSAEMRVAAAEARAVERVRYDTTVDRIETQYPALNVDHEEFDKEKAAEVLELKEAYQLKGYTPSAALQKAVKYVMPPVTVAQEKAVTVEPKVDPKEVEKARKAAAVAKTADAVARTPASAARVGLDSDKSGGGAVTAKDVIRMPYKDFATLDESALSALRGDVI